MIDKIKNFIEKWGGVICTTILIIFCIFAVVCDIYTAIIKAWVGVSGLIASVVMLVVLAYLLTIQIKALLKERKRRGDDRMD